LTPQQDLRRIFPANVMQLRPIFLAIGIMTVLLGMAMIPCALIDLADGRQETVVFEGSAFGPASCVEFDLKTPSPLPPRLRAALLRVK
jgi:hypothetical protein